MVDISSAMTLALLEPVFPSDLNYKIFNVYMDMYWYYVNYRSEDETFAANVYFASPTSPGYYYGCWGDTNEPPSNSYDNYYEDIFLSRYYMSGSTPTGNTVTLENGLIAEEYMYKDGTTELLYMVKDGYYVRETENRISVLIEMEDYCVEYWIYKIPENWTREKTWSLSAKPLVP